jgi:CheY-like chemotaxis protein
MTHSGIPIPHVRTDRERQTDVRVLIVDDQDAFRSVLRELVSATAGFALVREAVSGEDALAAVAELFIEFVVMDVRMPGLGGLAAARALLARRPGLVLLLASAQPLSTPLPTYPSGQEVSFISKERIRPAVLRDVWHAQGTASLTRSSAGGFE